MCLLALYFPSLPRRKHETIAVRRSFGPSHECSQSRYHRRRCSPACAAVADADRPRRNRETNPPHSAGRGIRSADEEACVSSPRRSSFLRASAGEPVQRSSSSNSQRRAVTRKRSSAPAHLRATIRFFTWSATMFIWAARTDVPRAGWWIWQNVRAARFPRCSRHAKITSATTAWWAANRCRPARSLPR